jgi:hypothetical protein
MLVLTCFLFKCFALDTVDEAFMCRAQHVHDECKIKAYASQDIFIYLLSTGRRTHYGTVSYRFMPRTLRESTSK